METKSLNAFAPATVANVSCAFDILGFAVEAPGDTVKVALTDKPGVSIVSISGDNGLLPLEVEKNTAGVAVAHLLQKLKSSQGILIDLNKGLPLGSGLGSSAASSAAAVFAVNEILGKPFSSEQLVEFALTGEEVACGTAHADNVAPALMGGFVLIRSYKPLDIIRIAPPPELHCSLLLPRIEINTSDARLILKKTVTLADAVKQWGNTAGLIAGLFSCNYDLISRSLEDHIIEPSRALLIPGYYKIKKAAIDAGALGCGISGSGPAVFALSRGLQTANKVADAMQAALNDLDIASRTFVSSIPAVGTRTIAAEGDE